MYHRSPNPDEAVLSDLQVLWIQKLVKIAAGLELSLVQYVLNLGEDSFSLDAVRVRAWF